jgi:hypothetical protein
MMRRRLKPMVVLAAAALLCAGCGDSGDGRETFDNGEFDITFEYPDELREAKDVTFSHSLGAKEQAKASVGIDKQNAILVTHYALGVEVTRENIADAKRETDALIRQVEPNASGRRRQVGGLPAIEYEVDVPSIEDARSRLVFIFDGADEYLINCQWKPDKREEIEDACRIALDTLERTG